MREVVAGLINVPSQNEIERYRDEGIIVLKNFVPSSAILEIRERISELASRIALERLSLKVEVSSDADNFDSGYRLLLEKNSSLAGLVYDATKKIPQVVRWAAGMELESCASALLGCDNPLWAARGYCIRADSPGDKVHKTQLHQDFHSQLGGLPGVVFWTPLRDVSLDMGPVIHWPSTHLQGVMPLKVKGQGSQDLLLDLESVAEVSSHAPTQDTSIVGDVIAIDYLLLHESGFNSSEKTRWCLMSRWFDPSTDISLKLGWRGGLQEGNLPDEDLVREFARKTRT